MNKVVVSNLSKASELRTAGAGLQTKSMEPFLEGKGIMFPLLQVGPCGFRSRGSERENTVLHQRAYSSVGSQEGNPVFSQLTAASISAEPPFPWLLSVSRHILSQIPSDSSPQSSRLSLSSIL